MSIKIKLPRCIEEPKKGANKSHGKKNILFDIIFIFVPVIISLAYAFLSYDELKKLISIMFTNDFTLFYLSKLLILLVVSVVFVLLIRKEFFRVLSKKYLFKKFVKKYKLDEKLNNYFLVCITLMLLVLFFGFNLANDYYENKLPADFPINCPDQAFNSEIYVKSIDEISSLDCKSMPNRYFDFVYPDSLYCNLTISYKNSMDVQRLSKITVSKGVIDDLTGDVQTMSPEEVWSGRKLGLEELYSFYLHNYTEGWNSFIIKYYFDNFKTAEVENSLCQSYLTFEALSKEDYEKSLEKRFPLVLTIITLALFSITALMKNIRDLMNPKT